MTQQGNERRDNPDRLSPEAERARDNFLSVRGRAVMTVVAVLIALSAIAYFATDEGTETTPFERADEQNSGVDAPLDQALSPGTVKDERGDPELPAQQ